MIDVDDALQQWTGDGRQAVVLHVPGWTSPWIEVRDTAAEIRAAVLDAVRYWVRYSDTLDVLLFGYDPRVMLDTDDPDALPADVLALWDGYPDAVGRIDLDTETLEWSEPPC